MSVNISKGQEKRWKEMGLRPVDEGESGVGVEVDRRERK